MSGERTLVDSWTCNVGTLFLVLVRPGGPRSESSPSHTSFSTPGIVVSAFEITMIDRLGLAMCTVKVEMLDAIQTWLES